MCLCCCCSHYFACDHRLSNVVLLLNDVNVIHGISIFAENTQQTSEFSGFVIESVRISASSASAEGWSHYYVIRGSIFSSLCVCIGHCRDIYSCGDRALQAGGIGCGAVKEDIDR